MRGKVVNEVDLGGERSFIGAWYLPDLKVCDEIIAFFNEVEGKEPGQIGHDREVNTEIKDSLDYIVEPQEFSHPVIRKYLINLFEVTKKYMEKFEAARIVNPWGLTENINIQYYKPGAGYKHWHT